MTFLDKLEPRERNVLLLGGGVIVAAVIYVAALEPFAESLARLQQEVPLARQQLAWMEDAAEEVRFLKKAEEEDRAAGKESQLAVIDKTAKQKNIDDKMKRIEPDDQNRIRVWLEDAVFIDVIQWIRLLESKGIVVDVFSAERLNKPGYVNARITLKGSS